MQIGLERNRNMSTTATLPLMIELTQPRHLELSSSLEESLRETLHLANTKYNTQTQVRENTEGIPQITNSGTYHKEDYTWYLDDDDGDYSAGSDN